MIWYFVFNPKAVNVNTELVKYLIKSYCEKINIRYEFIEMQSKEETIEHIKRIKNNYAIIYSVGGDGTLNTVLNGIIGGTSYLGILPFGSGNDFYQKMCTYNKTSLASNVMKVNNLYGLNIFSIGIDAQICANAEIMKKYRIPHKYIYICSMLYTFFKYKNEQLKITINNKEIDISAYLLATCNGSFYGGGFNIAPKADIISKDSLTYILEERNKLEVIKFLMKLMKGNHLEEFITLPLSKHIEITSKNPCIAQIDGEILNEKRYVIDTSAAQVGIVRNTDLIKYLTKKTR